MPCYCDEPPEPLSEQLDRRERQAKRQYQELYDCHERVVKQRDALLLENKQLRESIIKREIEL